MKKRFCLIISVLLIVSLCGCRAAQLSIYTSREDRAYQDITTELFDALDRKDAEAMYQLFSPAVREQDKDLIEQINTLFSVYTDTTDEIGGDGVTSGGSSRNDGKRSSYATAWFPVRSGNTYYWFYLNFMYENTFDETQIGLTQLEFYTADEFCTLWYNEEKLGTAVGLTVYAERTLEEEVRCINGHPYKYSSATKMLDLSDVRDFFNNSSNFSDFKTRFGEPNAECTWIYYELPQENGKPRYLHLSVCDDEITYANIVDDFNSIKPVFDREE